MPEVVKMTPDSLVSTIVEIRFKSNVPAEAVFGLVFQKLSTEYPVNSTSDLVQLPRSVRDQNPDLRYKALYGLNNDSVTVNIGPRVIVFNCHNGYLGWKVYFDKIRSALKEIENLSLIETVERIGLRYINFYDCDIYPNLNTTIDIMGKEYKRDALSINSRYLLGNYSSNLRIDNSALLNKNGEQKDGSILDIDSYYDTHFSYDYEQLTSIIDDLHSQEKKLFGDILSRDFLKKHYKAVFK